MKLKVIFVGLSERLFFSDKVKGLIFPSRKASYRDWRKRNLLFAVSSQRGIKLGEVYVQNVFPPVSPCSAVNQRGRSHARHLKVVILKPFCTPVVLLSIYPPSPSRFLSISLSQLLNEGLSALVIPGRGVFWRDEGCFFHPVLLASPVLFALQETVMLPVPWVATAALQSPR